MKDIFEILERFMPVGVSLLVLGFVYLAFLYKKIFGKMNDLAAKQSQYLTERINSVDTTTTIFERALKEQERQIEQLKNEISEKGVNLQSYNVEEVLSNVKNVKDELKEPIKVLTEKIEKLQLGNFSEDDFDTILLLANAYATDKEWIKSAEQYEKASKIKDDLWELYFSKGIAFANSRLGRDTDLKSLQSYSSAIAFFPDKVDLSIKARLDIYEGEMSNRLSGLKEASGNKEMEVGLSNIKARLYIYKGGILKRLHRLEEAESDIKFGLKYATKEYEVNDGLYNLACVYAMQNKEIEYSKIAEQLKNKSIPYFNYLIDRINKYAPKFKANKLG